MPRNDDNPRKQGRRSGDEPLDFGEFVSSNVQRTSDLLKGESGAKGATPPAQASNQSRPGGDRPVERARDRSYWRRKAAGSGEDLDDAPPPPQNTRGRNRYLPPSDEEIDQFHDQNEFDNNDNGGGGFSGFFGTLFSDDGDDGNRNRIIAAIIAVVILLLIIWGLTQLFGGDDQGDGEVSETPTPTQVVDAPSTPTDGPTDLTGEPTQPAATEEPEIPRGGDNQRGEEGGDGVASTPEPSVIAAEDMQSEVARACSGHCLVRVEGGAQETAFDEVGARASWAEGDISWIVVDPGQAELLDQDLTLTFIENDPRTYNLYVVKAAEDHNQRDVVAPQGEIIDETGRYYLVRWNSVPAVVKP